MNFGGYQGPHGAYYTQPPQAMGQQYNGAVYYNMGEGGHGTQASYARHDNGVQALNSLFGTIKQPNFNASSYAQISDALVQMHGVTLPPPVSSHGINYEAPHMETAYAQPLAHLSNVRGKNDLLLLEDRLQKMMNAIETHDRTAISVGPLSTEAPNANYAAPQLASAHHAGAATGEQTPALTPGSSAMSYSPGHSPTSDHSSMASSGPSGVPAYPHLQGAASLAGHSASVPSLGAQYDPNPQQRRSGGRLQRAAPAPGGSAPTTTRSSKVKRERDANIDPALVGPLSSSSSGSSEHTATPGVEAGEESASWLRDVRIIEDCLQLVKGMLSNSQYSDGGQGPADHGSDGIQNGDGEDMEVDKSGVSYPELPGMAK